MRVCVCEHRCYQASSGCYQQNKHFLLLLPLATSLTVSVCFNASFCLFVGHVFPLLMLAVRQTQAPKSKELPVCWRFQKREECVCVCVWESVSLHLALASLLCMFYVCSLDFLAAQSNFTDFAAEWNHSGFAFSLRRLQFGSVLQIKYIYYSETWVM